MGKPPPVVLVVEDDPAVRRWLTRSLHDLGYDVAPTDGIVMAERSLAAMRPDVLMLDLHLGEHSGLEVLRFVRDRPALADLPVLILTGDTAMTESDDEFIRQHHAYVCYKPSPISAIKETLERVLSSAAPTKCRGATHHHDD